MYCYLRLRFVHILGCLLCSLLLPAGQNFLPGFLGPFSAILGSCLQGHIIHGRLFTGWSRNASFHAADGHKSSNEATAVWTIVIDVLAARPFFTEIKWTLRKIYKASCRWPTKVLWIPEISAGKWPTPVAPNWFQTSHTKDNGSRWAPPSGIPLVACGWHWWPQSAVRPRSWCEFQRERSVTERWIKFGEIMGGKIKIRITLPISLNRGVGLVIKLVHGNQMSYSLCVTNAIGCTV